MNTVGIRELKQQTSEIVRQVRETGNPVQITYHGKVVALLVPVLPFEEKGGEAQAWAGLDELAVQIGRAWPKDLTASQAVSEGRE